MDHGVFQPIEKVAFKKWVDVKMKRFEEELSLRLMKYLIQENYEKLPP